VSLTSTPHLVAAVVCVVAAAVMLGRARGREVRAAHTVMLGCMVALALFMGSLIVVLGSAVLLALTAALVVVRSRDQAAHRCAVDLAACSGLVLLMAAPLLMAGHAEAPAPDSHGVHAGVHSMIPGRADHTVLLVALSASLVVAWASARALWARGSLAQRVDVTGWLMMATMGVMVATP